MKTNYYLILLLATLCLSATPVQAQGNLVVNGSFEANGGSLSSWSVVYNQFHIGVGVGSTPDAPDGNYIAYFSSYGGTISQVLSTVPGAYYDLTFSALDFEGNNSAGVSAGSLSVELNFTAPVVPLGSFVGNTNWQSFAFTFEASSTQTTLTFGAATQYDIVNDYYGTVNLDDIAVTAVPEPSIVALLGIGLAGVFICRRLIRLKHEN
jgi:Protein of unknown function (DUF642)/PEP-CTERM motif